MKFQKADIDQITNRLNRIKESQETHELCIMPESVKNCLENKEKEKQSGSHKP